MYIYYKQAAGWDLFIFDNVTVNLSVDFSEFYM